MTNTVHTIKHSRQIKPAVLAFILPVVILMILYIARGIFPFGDRAYMRMDFYHQYAPFMKEFGRRLLAGDSLLHAWEYGLGTNYWAHYAYYLASPFNWILALVPSQYVVEAMNISMILRAGIAGMGFVFFLKENRKENIAMAVFGMFYALSGYYMAYSCNIIWMDGFALFPLVALGVLRIAKGKSAMTYMVSMLICTFSNFYLAVIIGICCVFWLVICLVAGRKKNAKQVMKAIVKFILSTLLYVAICGVILLPSAYALMNTPAGESAFPAEPELYFPLYELFERMLMNVSSNLKGSDLPNIYASVLALVLLPMYFGNKGIRIKDKIIYGFTLVFLLVSFDLNILDYIWHGLHFPNSFPARQSFFYIFVLLVMGYEAYAKRKKLSKKVLWISLPLLLGVTGVAWYFLGQDNAVKGSAIYLCTLLFMAAYGILFLFEKYFTPKLFLGLLLVIGTLELGINTCVIGISSVVTRSAYMNDDVETAALLAEIMPGENEFYRMEEQDRKSINDAGWDGYYGASYFSSTMPGGTKEWYDAFGMRNSSVSYSYEGATPLVSSLLGVKYVFATEDGVQPGNTFTETVKIYGDDEVFLYENLTVLPLGYMVEIGLDEKIEYDLKNPFVTQNRFAKALLGEDVRLFTAMAQSKEYRLPEIVVSAGVEGDLNDETKPVEYTTLEIKAGENVFLYVNTYMEAICVEVRNGNGEFLEEREYDDLKFKRIVSLGVEDYDRTVVVYSADESVDKIMFDAYGMNEDVLTEIYQVLNRNPMEITAISDTKVEGKVTTGEEGVLLLSIPYEEGWSATVDGEETEIFGWKDAFVALQLQEGEHEIVLTYSPKGFKDGLLISLGGILCVVFYIFFYKKIKP